MHRGREGRTRPWGKCIDFLDQSTEFIQANPETVLSELQHDSFKNLQLMLSGLLRARAVSEAPDRACVSSHKAMPVLSGTMAA